MPRQSPLRTIKRWKRYEPRAAWATVPKHTRGVYVLYCHKGGEKFEVSYIGVAGLGATGGGGGRGHV
jgi:hypothetical protein